MFPGGNNTPYQPNMMGQPMGFNMPPPPGMMPNMGVPPFPPNIPSQYPPPPFPVQSSGYGAPPQTYNPGTSSSVYPSSGVSGGQQYTSAGTASTYPGYYQGQGKFGNKSTTKASSSEIPGQRKDSVAKMTIDFIKQFREEAAALGSGKSPMTIQSKASQLREGSPFSDVSDTLDISETPSGTTQPKSILRNKNPGGTQLESPKIHYQQGIARNPNTTQYSSTSQQSTDKSAPQISSGMSSILKNYQNEMSGLKDQGRSSSRLSDSKQASRSGKPRSDSPDCSSGRGRGDLDSRRGDVDRPRGGGSEKTSQSRSQYVPSNDRTSRRRRSSHKDDGLQDISDDDDEPEDPDHVQSQVYIGNLPRDISERDIHAYLVNYDLEVWIGYHKRERDDVCAFVKLPTMKDSKKLLSDIRSDIYKGQKLDVRFTAARDFTDYHVQLDSRARRSLSPREKRSFSPRRNRKSVSPRRNRRSITPRRNKRSASPRKNRRSVSPRRGRRSISPRRYRRSVSPKRDKRSVSPRRSRRSISPRREKRSESPRGERLDHDVSQQQQSLYYPQDVQYVSNPADPQGMQYIPNTGDPYSVPVYIMPQPTQQVFIPSFEYAPPMEMQGPPPTHYMLDSYGNQQPAYDAYGNQPQPPGTYENYQGHDNRNRDGSTEKYTKPHWRESARAAEKARLDKTLFMGYVESAFANAPILGKKYITEYLSSKVSRAVYVCSVCMEMCYDSMVADHVVGYRHRLKCFRKDQPEIYDKMCRIRNKSAMITECARMAADSEITHEKITIQICDDPDERGKKHLENIKDASFVGSSKSKSKNEDQKQDNKEDSSSSSGLDIFKRIAMYKKKIEETKMDENKLDESILTDDSQNMTFETSTAKNKTIADSIVADFTTKQQEEDKIRNAEETEKEKKREEEKMNKLKEEKMKEEEMKKRLEEARQKVIKFQKKVEEERLRKIEQERIKKEEELKRQRKLEKNRINEEKKKLAKQKKQLELERKLLEQQKLDDVKRKALEFAKKREEEIKAEEKRKEDAKREEEAKLKEEERKVELMLQMLENKKQVEDAQKWEEQRRLDEIKRQEALKKQMEEKRIQLWENEQLTLKKAAEERQLVIQKAEEERQLAIQMAEVERMQAEKTLMEHQEKTVQEIKNRHNQLQLLQETEEKRQKELIASQKRSAALKRIEEMKKSKPSSTEESPTTTTEEIPLIYEQKYYDTHEHDLTFEQKVLPLRRRAYLTLPFSMEEKRMHLRTSIGPEDKIGPDPNSKIDSVLALKYNMKGAEYPLIGLQYVVEGFEGKDGRQIHRYYCEICCVETFHCDGLLQHIIGFTHRTKYLELHKPALYDDLMKQDMRRATLNELVKKEAMKIEQDSGRHQIPTLAMCEFRMYSKKMKQVEATYRDTGPTMSENAFNIKQAVMTSEKDDRCKVETPCDPTVNIQGIVNKTLAMACEISIIEGNNWVDFYKYVHQRKLKNEPMLGLKYITEVRGNRKYSPKYTCSLCDIVPVGWAQDIYSHLNSIQHLEKYLSLVHPEKILGNEHLSSKVLSKPEHNKIIRDIAQEVGAAQTVKENIKVGVLLLENVWKLWHDQCQGNSKLGVGQEDYVSCTTASILKLRPQLYDIVRNFPQPICGFGSLTEIQNDIALTKYQCDLCDTSSINQKNVIGHLRGRKHRKMYLKKKGFDSHHVMNDMDKFLQITPDNEIITVKKVLYLDLQGQIVYSDPEVMKDPGPQQREEKKPSDETTKPATSTKQVVKDTPKAADTPHLKTPATTNETDKDKGRSMIGQRPTKFDKIIKGLDYTPLLGIEYMTEVQSETGIYPVIYECELCRQTGKISQLGPKNILRHLGTKGHRLSFIQKKHIAAYQDVKSVLGKREREKKLDQHTKEIASKFGRGKIKVRVENDDLFFNRSREATEDDVLCTIGKLIPKLAGCQLLSRGRPDLKPGRQIVWKCNQEASKQSQVDGPPPQVVFVLLEEQDLISFNTIQIREVVLQAVRDAHAAFPSAQLVWVDNPWKDMSKSVVLGTAVPYRKPLLEKWKRTSLFGLRLVEKVLKGEPLPESANGDGMPIDKPGLVLNSGVLIIGDSIPEIAGREIPKRGRSEIKPGKHILWKCKLEATIDKEAIGSPPQVIFIVLEDIDMISYPHCQIKYIIAKEVFHLHKTYPLAQLIWVDIPFKTESEWIGAVNPAGMDLKRKHINSYAVGVTYKALGGNLVLKPKETREDATDVFIIGDSIPEIAGRQIPKRWRREIKPGKQILWKCNKNNIIDKEAIGSPPQVIFILLEDRDMITCSVLHLKPTIEREVLNLHETYPLAQLIWVDIRFREESEWLETENPARIETKRTQLNNLGNGLVYEALIGNLVLKPKETGKDDTDEPVIITKIETKESKESEDSEILQTSPVEPKKSPRVEAENIEDLPKEPPLNIDQYINTKDYDVNIWKQDNELINDNMKNSKLVPSSRCSKFVVDYNAAFCTYPIIGLQWITEFHQSNSTWWCVCRLCEETIDESKYLTRHVTSLKHRLRYIQNKYPPIYLALKREQFTAKNENLLRAKVYKHSQDIMKTEGKEFKPEVMLQKCFKLKAVKPASEKVSPIQTISRKISRTIPTYTPTKYKSQSANILVLTPENTSDNSKKDVTPQKRNNTEDVDSDKVSKRLRIDSGESASVTQYHNTKTVSKSNQKMKGEGAPQTEEENLIEDMITIWDDDSREDMAGSDTAATSREVQQTNRSKDTVDFRGLKRKAAEDLEIQTKTPHLKGEHIDSSDDDVKIKKSKVDHKSRGYRDSYGSSYGQEHEKKKISSRSSDSRQSSSSRHRQSSRDRRVSDRDKSRKSSSRRDDTVKSKSSQRSKVLVEHDKTVDKEENVIDTQEEPVESEEDDDFNAFVMAQLGEDFVTVDELEDMEEDIEPTDMVERESIIHKDVGLSTDQDKKEIMKTDSGNLKAKNENLDVDSERQCDVKLSDTTVSANEEKSADVSTPLITKQTGNPKSVNSAEVGRIEVSVVLEEQKPQDKSDMSAKKVVVPSTSRTVRSTNVQVEVKLEGDSEAATPCRTPVKEESQSVEVIKPKSISAKPSFCPFLGIPISSSTSQLVDDQKPLSIDTDKHVQSNTVRHSDEKADSTSVNIKHEGLSELERKGDMLIKKEMEAKSIEVEDSLSTKAVKEAADTPSVVVEIGDSSDVNVSSVSMFDEKLGESGRGFVTVDIAESDSKVPKKGSKLKIGKKKIVSKVSKKDNSVKTETKKHLSNNAVVEIENDVKSDKKEVIESKMDVEIDKEVVFETELHKSKDDKEAGVSDQENSKGSKALTEPLKGNIDLDKTVNKKQVKSSAKSQVETPSPSTRQTRSSRVTVVTMEMAETSPEKAKTNKNVKKDKKANECEVSIEIG